MVSGGRKPAEGRRVLIVFRSTLLYTLNSRENLEVNIGSRAQHDNALHGENRFKVSIALIGSRTDKDEIFPLQ